MDLSQHRGNNIPNFVCVFFFKKKVRTLINIYYSNLCKILKDYKHHRVIGVVVGA